MENSIIMIRSQALLIATIICFATVQEVYSFTTSAIHMFSPADSAPVSLIGGKARALQKERRGQHSASALNMVWWFGGAEAEAKITLSGDSCELVAVRIESPSANSRRIKGEITVEGCSLLDVWAILTDYDRLAIHVPNLVESRRMGSGRGGNLGPATTAGGQGDGSYECRLFQRGAQKIVGFEFGASVTMDMTEEIICEGPHISNYEGTNGVASVLERNGLHDVDMFPAERRIKFKCVESQFFGAFDGEWRVREQNNNGEISSVVTYTVLVKPRGPVPVAALEWRIREDVPTNLRAVKKAASEVGYEGVMNFRNGDVPLSGAQDPWAPQKAVNYSVDTRQSKGMLVDSIKKNFKREPFADWGEDETMAAYLNN
jgi:uncharacterized protein YodC (DUF2158 family)